VPTFRCVGGLARDVAKKTRLEGEKQEGGGGGQMIVVAGATPACEQGHVSQRSLSNFVRRGNIGPPGSFAGEQSQRNPPMAEPDHAREVFLVGLKNAHAMEKQALSIMQPQLNRLEHYPELSRSLSSHIAETETQIERLDEVLGSMGESNSTLKDTLLSAFGSMAALGHVTAGDEVLKNSFANLAFENYEIAAYTSLISSARICGESSAVGLLEQSLAEERRMAELVEESIPSVTETFISLKRAGETAKM
jgi:ferritin-like metal-binding protein YciE